ncbi:MAG: hypothetical protein ACRDT2_05985 [Natronosporangium sp.]
MSQSASSASATRAAAGSVMVSQETGAPAAGSDPVLAVCRSAIALTRSTMSIRTQQGFPVDQTREVRVRLSGGRYVAVDPRTV